MPRFPPQSGDDGGLRGPLMVRLIFCWGGVGIVGG